MPGKELIPRCGVSPARLIDQFFRIKFLKPSHGDASYL
jgi:hypothetical protein